MGRVFRVLTLHRDENDVRADLTPALSSNYLPIGIKGELKFNEWANVRITAGDTQALLGTGICHDS
jgi:hypothetical protein